MRKIHLFKEVDLVNDRPLRAILLFSLPIFITALLGNAFSLINALVLKMNVGGDSVTSITSTGPISSILFNFAYGCSSGFAVISSNYYGQNKKEELANSFFNSLYLILVLSIFISSIGFFTLNPLINFLNINPIYVEGAKKYFEIILISFIFLLLNNYITNFLRSIGNSKMPLFLSLSQTIINIVLAIFFTGVIKLNTRGVALATLLANALCSLFGFIYIFKKYPHMRINKINCKLSGNTIKQLTYIGIPLGFQWTILFIGSFIQAQHINQFGDGLATKAASAYQPFESYLTMVFSVLSTAMLNYVGQNFGAKKIDRIKEGIKISAIINVSVYVVILCISLPFVTKIAYIFIPKKEINDEIIFYSSRYLFVIIPCLIMQSFIMLSRAFLQGIKKPLIPFLSGIGELFARLFACMVLPLLVDKENPISNKAYISICFSTPLAWLISTLIMGLSMMYYLNKLLKELPSNDVIL